MTEWIFLAHFQGPHNEPQFLRDEQT